MMTLNFRIGQLLFNKSGDLEFKVFPDSYYNDDLSQITYATNVVNANPLNQVKTKKQVVEGNLRSL